MARWYVLVTALLLCVNVCHAEDMEITPFRTTNQRPLVQIYGLPAESSAAVLPAGRMQVGLTQDIANEYATRQTATERLTLDGESYRWTLFARYGINDRLEAGIDIPYVMYDGGFLDGFIDDWHKTFNLPRGGRDTAPKNHLNYSYNKDGLQKLMLNHAGSGIGDIVLSSGLKLYDVADGRSHDSLVLRTTLKLPTGESGSLRGSGSVDASLSVCGSMNSFTEWGSLGTFGSAGVLAMTRGDVLPTQQNNIVGFGTIGLGWGPSDWISFKVQLNAHTAFYHGSSLDELSQGSLMLITGGAVKLPNNFLLDIGASEDVAVATAPDVTFHLGLSRRF